MAEEKSKYQEWTPSGTNQIRLRHLRKICARCVAPKSPLSVETSLMYYTLHVTMMSAPFYTSESLTGDNIDWSDIDCRKFPENIVTSCPGIVIRLWARDENLSPTPELVTVWGVYFSGLLYLGSQIPKEGALFLDNCFIFGTSWGYFVSCNSLKTLISEPVQSSQDAFSLGYNIPSMCRIHRMQRAIYKEGSESNQLRQEIQLVQSNPARYRSKSVRAVPSLVTPSLGDQQLLQELRAKRQVAVARVSLLHQERTKHSWSVDQLKETLKNMRVDNHTRALHLKEKQYHLQMGKERLTSMVKNAAGIEEQYIRIRQQLSFRRRQLFQEISEIFPIVEVKNGVYSINNVILPNSDGLTGSDDTQLSVALGHVTHVVQMISIFLQVPNRYPVFVCSSRSRIVDQASQRDLDSQKEFPLYPKGKDRLYFEYAVYLLNKNIAQLRWVCGLSTKDLAATLPNLSSLVQHLVTPQNEPPEDGRIKRVCVDNAETKASSSGHRGSSISSTSTGQIFRSKWPIADQQSTASTFSLDHLTDSPQAGAYFKHPPSQHDWMNSSSTLSLDLAVDRLHFSPLFSPVQFHGSAPDLCSPELPPSTPFVTQPPEARVTDNQREIRVPEEPPASSATAAQQIIAIQSASTDPAPSHTPDLFAADDVMSSVSARTELLASTSSTFKLRGRGRHPSSHGNA